MVKKESLARTGSDTCIAAKSKKIDKMKNVDSSYLLIMIIGLLAIISNIYMAFSEGGFQDYFFGLFIGISLFGAAYIGNNEWKKKKEADSKNA